jgi:hypothetical protein
MKMGVQKIEWSQIGWLIDDEDSDVSNDTLSSNDGLHIADFLSWFRKVVSAREYKPMAIIHFTNFRYV